MSNEQANILFTWFADQNQPLISLGKNSGLSHPSKLHFLVTIIIIMVRWMVIMMVMGTVMQMIVKDDDNHNRPSRSPEELGASQESFHPAVLGLRLKGDQVHATLPKGSASVAPPSPPSSPPPSSRLQGPSPAVVSCIEPIPLGVPNLVVKMFL